MLQAEYTQLKANWSFVKMPDDERWNMLYGPIIQGISATLDLISNDSKSKAGFQVIIVLHRVLDV